jgi:hypothetical protein
MRKILPTLLVMILGCAFYISSLYLYKQDISRHDNEIIKVAKEVKSRLDKFNEHIIIKDNVILKDKQETISDRTDEMLKILKKLEEKSDGKGISK